MDLKDLITSIRNYEGITRKNMIKGVTSLLKDSYNITGKTVLGIGDDASANDIDNQQLLLLANEGVLKFGVPMVGGHLHPDTPYNALDVAITGLVGKDDVITSGGAQVGDQVIMGIDLDGKPHEKFPLNWDTTTFKSSELVQDQIRAMNRIARKHLVTAGKDISNPGTLGTLGMLLEASDVGASIELEKIPRNQSVDWDSWLKIYPGSGFVLTTPEENVKECIKLLEEVNITANTVGEIIQDRIFYLSYQGEREVLFNFHRDRIMGVKQEI